MAEKRPELKVGDKYKILNGEGRLHVKVFDVERYNVTLKVKPDEEGGQFRKTRRISRQLFWRQVDAAV